MKMAEHFSFSFLYILSEIKMNETSSCIAINFIFIKFQSKQDVTKSKQKSSQKFHYAIFKKSILEKNIYIYKQTFRDFEKY